MNFLVVVGMREGTEARLRPEHFDRSNVLHPRLTSRMNPSILSSEQTECFHTFRERTTHKDLR